MNEQSECGKCGAVIDKIAGNRVVVCEGICNKQYHLVCAGIDEDAAKIVEDNINVSFVCNLCTVFTPTGLFNKINEIFQYVQTSKAGDDKKHEVFLKNQENLTSTVRSYLKEIIKENKINRLAIQESNIAITDLTKKIQFVEYKIDKIGDETSTYQYSRVIQSFKDFDKTLDTMAEVTTNIVESGLERQSKIVSQLNDTMSEVLVSNRAIEEFAATTVDLVQTNHGVDVTQQQQLITGVEEKIGAVLNRFETRVQKVVQKDAKNKNGQTEQIKEKQSKKSIKPSGTKTTHRKEISDICTLPNGNVVISFENEKLVEDEPQLGKSNQKKSVSKQKIVTFADKLKNHNGRNVIQRRSLSGEDTTTPSNKRPSHINYVKVKIVGLSEKLEEREMNQSLQDQNTFIKNTYSTKLLKYEESRNPHNKYHKFNAIVEMEKTIVEKSIQAGKINIKWDKCYVVEEILVTRCFNCSGYNHRSDKCSNKTACPKCSGEHMLSDCKSKEVQCINCVSFNNKLKLNLNTKHSALSKYCEVFQRKLQLKKEFLSGTK